MNKIFIYLLFMPTLIACNKQSEELSTEIKDTNLRDGSVNLNNSYK